MTPYKLIGPHELDGFTAVVTRHGWQSSDFELQEDVFDPATAEVEAALGEVGVQCLRTQAVTTYRVGTGLDWVAEFEADLRAGRLGEPPGARP
jgi:hypothetical protein